MTRFIIRASPWLLLCLIIFWTLGPVGERPKFGFPQLERFAAYFALGASFQFAYRRGGLIAMALCCVAIGLELGQLLIPGRDAGLIDACAKVAGALTGVWTVTLAFERLAAFTRLRP